MPRINPFEHGLTPEDLGMKRPQEKAVEAALRHVDTAKEARELDFEEVREIFGEDFLGIEEAERFSGRPFTQEERQEILDLWEEKVRTQNLTREDLERLKHEGFMVVVRPSTMMLEDKEAPVTIMNLKKKHPDLFYADRDWFHNEDFAKTGTIQDRIAIVKKELLGETRNKNWDEQQEILTHWAEEHNLDPKMVKRRTPVEIAHDVLGYFNARQQRILEKDWDWTSVRSSDGRFVFVGGFDRDGLYVYSGTRDYSPHHALGVAPAR